MASAAASDKAFLQNLDTGDLFDFQFNPKEFKINDKATWKSGDAQKEDKPLLTYEKGDPSTVSMDLIFDMTDTGEDVYQRFIDPLRGFLYANVEDSDKEGHKMMRPPYCLFVWGSFTFDCVVESLNTTAIMFDRNGNCIRAKVTLSLKEHNIEAHDTADTGVKLQTQGYASVVRSQDVRTHTLTGTHPLTTVAPTNWRDVAIANGISDPMNPPVGRRIAIPLNSDLAAVMGAQFLGYHPNKWVGDLAIVDDGVPYRGPSASSQGSSAFRDSPSAAPSDAELHSASGNGGGGALSPAQGSGPPGGGAAGGASSRPGASRPAGGRGSRGRGRTAFDT